MSSILGFKGSVSNNQEEIYRQELSEDNYTRRAAIIIKIAAKV